MMFANFVTNHCLTAMAKIKLPIKHSANNNGAKSPVILQPPAFQGCMGAGSYAHHDICIWELFAGSEHRFYEWDEMNIPTPPIRRIKLFESFRIAFE